MLTHTTIGERLRRAIKASPLSLTQLAAELHDRGIRGSSRAMVARYVNDELKGDPPLAVLMASAEILDVSPMWLAFDLE